MTTQTSLTGTTKPKENKKFGKQTIVGEKENEFQNL